MDPLNVVLLCWLAIAGFVFFVLQKFMEATPDHRQRQVQQKPPDTQPETYGKKDVVESRSERSESSETSSEKVTVTDSAPWRVASTAEPAVNLIGKSVQVMNFKPKSHADAGKCVWLNELSAWFFAQYKGVPGCVNVWLKAMNEAAKKVATTSGCEILLEELVEGGCSAPEFSDVKSETSLRDHLTLRGAFYCPKLSLRLVSSQRVPDKLLVSNYEATLHDIRGDAQVRLACIGNELYLMGCLEGRPELDLTLKNADDTNSGSGVDPALVEDSLRRCLATAVTNLSLNSLIDVDDSDTIVSRSPEPAIEPVVEEVWKRISGVPPQAKTLSQKALGNRLLVKVLRASKLGADRGAHQPFVIVELDDPSQRHTTSLGLNAYPHWEEEFLFELNKNSEEILFEVYDKKAEEGQESVFMGLAIVGVEELRNTTATVHTLTLQSRPYKTDPVSGSLTAEFVFMDDGGAEIGKLVATSQQRNLNGVLTQTQSTARRPVAVLQNGTDEDTELFKPTPTKTSTVWVKSVSQAAENNIEPAPIANVVNDIDLELEPLTVEAAPSVSPTKDTLQVAENVSPSQYSSATEYSTKSEPTPPPRQQKSSLPPSDRGRSEKRSGGFLDDLRQRLSFSKTRKKRAVSVEVSAGPTGELAAGGKAASTPPSRDASETRPAGGGRAQSVGAGSTDSLYQQSTLVIESTQQNAKKYYLIPPNMYGQPQTKKLLRKGRKLHIFNEHTYIAVHVRTGTTCALCRKLIPRSFGKQAYQCRDCRLVCHKRCHFKSEGHCLNSRVSQLQMEYLWNK